MNTPVTVTAGTVQVTVPTTVTRTQAQNLSHYSLTTATGTTVKLRSAQYDARTHKVTLRLAHPSATRITQARLTVTGLGSTGSSVKVKSHTLRHHGK